jgi:hypothetical protein
MKPDWQNKSYAKTSSPTAPSTTHPKLKLGMTSLHSKIAVANNNMPQTPKPAVRKFADGGEVTTRDGRPVTTRSDNQIWWESQTGNRGKSYPGDDVASKQYEADLAQREKNLQTVKNFFNKFNGDKATTAVKENESNMSPDSMASTYYTGKKDSAAVSPMEMKAEENPSYKADVLKAVTVPKEAKAAAPAPAPAPRARQSAPWRAGAGT